MTLLCFMTILGIFFRPVFTFGCVLIYYEHPLLGVLALLISMFKENEK